MRPGQLSIDEVTADEAEARRSVYPRRTRAGAAIRRRSRRLLPLLGSFVLAAVFGRVALLNLNTGLVGGYVDGYENLWNYYWVKTALLDLHTNPYYSNYLYYPTGISLRFHTLNPANGLLTMPLNLTLGYVPTVNLLFVVAMALTMLFAYLLLRDLVGNAWASFAGAAAFTFAQEGTLGFFSRGQAERISAEWLPLYFLFMFRALHGRPLFKAGETEGRSAGSLGLYIVLSILTLLALSLTDWQYLMYAVLASVLYGTFLLLTNRSWAAKWRLMARLASIGGIYAAIVAFPLVLPMVSEARANPWLVVSGQAVWHSLDLASFLLPGLGNPGYLAMAVALVGLWAAIRSHGPARQIAIFWAMVGGVFFVMALGPDLTVNGRNTGVPMPYSLLQNLPVLNIGRDPGRYYTMVMLAVGVLVAFGLRALFDYLPRLVADVRTLPTRRSTWVAGITTAFLVITLFGFFVAAGDARVDALNLPPFYRRLAQDQENYAILELPPFTEKGKGGNTYMAYQTVHNKFKFDGRWSRDHKLDNPNNFVKTSSLFHDLWLLDQPKERREYYRPARDILTPTDYSAQGVPILAYYDTRYVVLYKEAISPPDRPRYIGMMEAIFSAGAKPEYEDAAIRVYRVPLDASAANPITLDIGDGWYKAATNENGQVYRWADNTESRASELYAMNLTRQPLRATLTFVAYTYKRARTIDLAINHVHVTSLAVRPEDGQKLVRIEVTLAPGNNLLAFSTPEAPLPTDDPAKDARLLSFGVIGLELKTE